MDVWTLGLEGVTLKMKRNQEKMELEYNYL